ncbi:S-adenosyl-L-methionine-dependent methyltransferase [Nemania sp. FL0031]|nr:S-adenosyl-L-methionine-dependent methyltransferase [Nemania sp. FL0031]
MADDSVYALNASTKAGVEQETDRLDAQHRFFDDVMNNELLPPHIVSYLESIPSPRVCDFATGTTVWLKEIAKTLPTSAELVGLDFDTSKFPKAEALPSNVTLGVANGLQPFPEEYRNRFDVVHLRFFLFALKQDQGVALVKNLLSLLRPGGWLVWVETNPSAWNAEPPSEGFYQYQKFHALYAHEINLETNTPWVITSCIRQAGLKDCDERIYNSASVLFGPKGSDWPARQHHELFTGMSQVVKGMLSQGGVDGLRTQEDMDEAIAKLKEDMDGTRKWHIPVVRAWGRKP